MLELTPLISQLWRGRGRPGFGLVNLMNNRGLGTESRQLESLFSRHFGEMNFSIYPIPAGRRGQRFDDQWQSSRLFRLWLARQGMVMTIERFMPKLFKACAEQGIRTLWRPNQEWIEPGYETGSLEGIDCIMAPHKACAKLLLGRFGLTNVISNPWVLDLPIREKMPSESGTRFLFNAGRGGVGDRRNVATVVAAFARVLPQRPDIHLTFKTQIPLDVSALKAMRSSNFTYVETNTSYRRNLAFYEDADFSVAPSKWEGVGYALLESLYCGTPVLSVDAAPMNEWVSHRESGYLVPARFPDIDLPIPYARNNPDGVNWVPAAHCAVDDLVRGIHWMADNRQSLYRHFNATNTATLTARLQNFTDTFGTVLKPLASHGPEC